MKKLVLITLVALMACNAAVAQSQDGGDQDKLTTQTQDRFKDCLQKIEKTCDGAGIGGESEKKQIQDRVCEALQDGATPKEVIKLVRAMTRENISGLDLSVVIEMVGQGVKAGLEPKEVRNTVMLSAREALKLGISGTVLGEMVGDAISARIAIKGEPGDVEGAQKRMATAKEKMEEILQVRYGELAGRIGAPEEEAPKPRR